MRRPTSPVPCLWSALALHVLITSHDVASAQENEISALVEDAKRAIHGRDFETAGRLLDRAIARRPDRADVYVLRASVYGSRKLHDRAVALMRGAREQFPDDPEVLTTLGIQLVLATRYQEGDAVLREVVSRWPRRWEAHVVLGGRHLATGRWKPAVAAYEAYFATRPEAQAGEDQQHRLGLARAYLGAERPADARRAYGRVLNAEPANEAARLGAFWATAAVDCRPASDMFASLADLEQAYPSVLLVRGRCELALGRSDDALTTARRYREARGDDVLGLALLGDVHEARRSFERAQRAFALALARQPDSALNAYKLARVERRLGRPAEAVDRLRTAGPPPGAERDWTLELGEALLATGRARDVGDLLAGWVAEHPDDAAARVVLGRSAFALGDLDAAIAELERALSIEPKAERARRPLVDALNSRAVAAMRANDLPGARGLLERALRAGDNDPTTWRNLGVADLQAGEPRAAVPALVRAVAGAQDDPDVHRALALAHRRAGDLDAARRELGRAAQLVTPASDAAAAVAIELAAVELAADRGDEASRVLDAALANATDRGARERLLAARVTVGRAVAASWMRRGEFERAYRLLRPLADAAGDNVPAPLRCELALAATGARQHTTALRLAQALERAGARCPFLPPLDQLGVPILLAWNRARVGSDASAGLADLDRLRSHSAGAGLSLIDAAVRDIALQAARRSYESGAARSARSYLAVAARHGNSDPRVRHNLAVLEVESGNVDAAIAVFEAVSAVVPEALVNLGVAYERKDQPTLALSYYRRALAAGVRFEPLEQWIERKRRLWAERGGDD